MSTSSAGCRSVLVLWAGALFCSFLPLAVSARAEEPSTSFVRLKWLSDLGAESIAAGESTPRAGQDSLIAVAPGAAYSFALDSDGSLRKLNKLAADSSIPYGAATSGDAVVLAASDGSVSLWRALEALQWRKQLGERVMSVGWNGGDTVLVATRSGRLLALASTDGGEVWTVDIGGRAEGAPVRDGASVFVATKSNILFRIDAATGKIRWKVELPGPALHPPVVAGEDPRRVLSGTWNGHLVAFDVSSGAPLWSVDLPDRLAGAPVAGDDFVAAVTSDGTVRAYELSGELRWKTARAASGAAGLLIHEKLLVISNVLKALDLATGEPLADYPEGAVHDLKQRFLDAMIEGEKIFTKTEKTAIIERESFPISGRLFGEARLQDDTILFSTEDGWIYLFGASSLRPLSRYRAGQRVYDRPLLSSQTVVAASSDEIFGLDPGSGQILWRRTLGEVKKLAAGAGVLGVIAEDHLSVLDLSSGTRRWRAPGEFQSVCAPGTAKGSFWLVVSAEDRLELFDLFGNLVGEPFDIGGVIVSAVSTGARRWAVATKDGRLLGVSQPEPYGASDGNEDDEDHNRLRTRWEVLLDEPVRGMSVAADTLLVESEGGYLAGLAELDGQELWRLPLDEGARYQLEPGTSTMVLFDADTLRVYDLASGEPAFEQELTSPAVGVVLQGNRLLWLDRSGRAHRTSLMEGDIESNDLGAPLEQAFSIAAGFVVTTTAGEVGLAVVENDGFKQEEER